jgi:Fe-S-cluster containining protein
MNRNERRLAKKEAPKSVAAGIDPSRLNEYVMAELARQIHSRLDQAKRSLNVDPTIDYVLSKIDATIKGMSDVPIACGKGCSHCCNIWVSATAPEVLYIAKRLSAQATDRVREANEFTKAFSHEQRPFHPNACPLLQNNECSIYQHRPLFCRLAASADAEVCRRSYTNITDEGIPTPMMYLAGRDAYSTALAVALKAADLPYLCYEFNSALNIALTTPDAEKAWSTGSDIFAGALKQDDAVPFEESPGHTMLYDLAFGDQ